VVGKGEGLSSVARRRRRGPDRDEKGDVPRGGTLATRFHFLQIAAAVARRPKALIRADGPSDR